MQNKVEKNEKQSLRIAVEMSQQLWRNLCSFANLQQIQKRGKITTTKFEQCKNLKWVWHEERGRKVYNFCDRSSNGLRSLAIELS